MYRQRTRLSLGRALADAFLAGPWEEAGLLARGTETFGRRPGWLRAVVRAVVDGYHRPPADRPRELAAFIAVTLEARRPAARDARPPAVRRRFVAESQMGRRRWPVPELAATADLAAFLGLNDGTLAWLADARGLERTVDDERLRNYRYDRLPRDGGPPRVIERPKARLKAAQRRVLHDILDWIPAHPAAHGFTRGRSARTHAAEHTGRRIVVRLDLEDFFASVEAGRVYGIFRTAGYPEAVAHALTALTTNALPVAEWGAVPRPADPALLGAHHRLGRRLATPHLPQGAPTSPTLANLAAFRLDRRLSGLARAAGLAYSRYADDLTFSGERQARALPARVAQIAREEGFAVNPRKSAFMTGAGRQRVCGIVVNERPNVARGEYDVLKAILHNAARRGAAAENRAEVPDFRAHLLGRIAWVESLHRERGAELRRRYAQIAWD